MKMNNREFDGKELNSVERMKFKVTSSSVHSLIQVESEFERDKLG